MRTRRRAPLASQVAAWNRALQSTVDLGGGVKGEGDHGVAAEFITLDEVLGLSRFSTSRTGRRLTPVSAANSPRTRRRLAGIWPLRMYRRGSSKSFSPNRSRLISFMASGS
jgi:hypothetical protein